MGARPSRLEIRDQERRETVERYHLLKDAEEDYEAARASTTDRAEMDRVTNEFAAFRRQHREEDARRGKRAARLGISVRMHQIMWARWIEVAVAHEMAARQAYDQICAGDNSQLVEELRQSLVAVAAAASTVEALYEDVRYLIAEPPRQPTTTPKRISKALITAFGLDPPAASTLLADLTCLFERRNEGVHPYAESEAPQAHPSGVNTGAEMSRFNSVESRKAVDVAMRVLELGANPPAPHNRWVGRWAVERSAYHTTVVAPLRTQR